MVLLEQRYVPLSHNIYWRFFSYGYILAGAPVIPLSVLFHGMHQNFILLRFFRYSDILLKLVNFARYTSQLYFVEVFLGFQTFF